MRDTRLIVEGLLVGAVLCETIAIWRMRKTCGTLKIDHKSKDKELYRFVIDDFDALSKKKYVRLKVDNNADLSQHQQPILWNE